jgi:hypothetical protein
MELNIQKSKLASFTHNSNCVHFNYYISNGLILRSGCIKDLDVMLNSKLYFHCHVDFVYSQACRASRLIRYIMYKFSSLDCLVVLHNAEIRSKLDYAFVTCNNLTITDSNKIENIQRKFANLCYYHLFQFDILCSYDLILNF